jgi:hypothetical protein
MNRINSTKQLKFEKKKLKQRQGELEKAIRYDWKDVKETMKPQNLAGQAFSGIFDGKDTERRSFQKWQQNLPQRCWRKRATRLVNGSVRTNRKHHKTFI